MVDLSHCGRNAESFCHFHERCPKSHRSDTRESGCERRKAARVKAGNKTFVFDICDISCARTREPKPAARIVYVV